ncbi:methyltransferase [Amylibacter sp. SFDW26]|uniref:tRNA1(Val) (adenine(37)-N6)-methyltransferase n=1 Tax=Amylibacter sp. SFDW26 TaxID=2652722 RepID=UPI0012629AF5|nr:methyltransferase [Amylibacter sp. SFDW26]KAB7614774.1 methyltransferase [Amylibacter sp. SFDW26]
MRQIGSDITQDAFLGGALQIRQPKVGYRAATDPVFLAASVPVNSGQTVLELGCGVGVAMLCLGFRVPDCSITGLEIQPEYAELARENACMNNIDAAIVSGDLMQMPQELRDQSFDHVMFNPPFYDEGKVTTPNDSGKSQAFVMSLDISDWVKVAMKRLKPKGRLTFIHRIDVLPKALGALDEIAGDITIKPLVSREDQSAKRIIVTCRKGTNGPPILRPPFVIHNSETHDADAGAYSKVAEGVLRNGDALPIS